MPSVGEWFVASPAWAVAVAGTAYFALLYFAVLGLSGLRPAHLRRR